MTLEQGRRAIGVWAEWPDNARWTNEGMTRLLGFLIEGIARSGRFVLRIVVPESIRVEAEEDLSTLDAVNGRDFTIHSPGENGSSFRQLATFANDAVPVDAWLSLFPYFSSAKLLHAPVTVIFADAIPKVFHEFGDRFWGDDGAHLKWDARVRELLAVSAGAITFSDHVADKHLSSIFGFPRERISVVPHSAPDLSRFLPSLQQRSCSASSLKEAGDLLRSVARSRGWDYLRDFPFEEVRYLGVSTQDRVTKNIQLAARAVQILNREQRQAFKLLTTAPLHVGEPWAALPTLIEETLSQFDVISMPGLPREAHAAFLHCAALAVHPSIFEGGHAPFPFFEAVSVGTPCIMASGPHLREIAGREPGLLSFSFDPNDAGALAGLIADVLSRRDVVLAQQREIYVRFQENDWQKVADAYADAALQFARTRG